MSKPSHWPTASPRPSSLPSCKTGLPKSVTTDRGSQFESTLFSKLCDFLGCERIRTTAFHLAENEMVERLHRQLKAALMSHADREHWVDNLPIVIYRHSSLACATDFVYGSHVFLQCGRVRGSLQPPDDGPC